MRVEGASAPLLAHDDVPRPPTVAVVVPGQDLVRDGLRLFGRLGVAILWCFIHAVPARAKTSKHETGICFKMRSGRFRIGQNER